VKKLVCDSFLDLTFSFLSFACFLHDVVEVGDELELRGPIGGWFVWDGESPAVLVGGGSGVVPLMAMLRLARRTGRSDRLRVVVSVRSPADVYYPDELPGPETTIVYTRESPPGVDRAVGRLTADDVALVLVPDATAYVCGSARFAEAASSLLVEAGVPVERIRVERFGPTG
jgi:ferredoxin-NADP reductase